VLILSPLGIYPGWIPEYYGILDSLGTSILLPTKVAPIYIPTIYLMSLFPTPLSIFVSSHLFDNNAYGKKEVTKESMREISDTS
jgi:hypothetical protein